MPDTSASQDRTCNIEGGTGISSAVRVPADDLIRAGGSSAFVSRGHRARL